MIAPEGSFAKGGPGGGTPAVTSTSPSFGARGQQHLSVRVLGSGYNATAVARWERGGVADPKITVHTTTFVSSSELLADISIAVDADTALYDVSVEVETSNGRKKGVGVEMFVVTDVLTLDGAIRADAQPVIVEQDDATLLWLRNGTNIKAPFVSEINFANTIAAGTGPCVSTNSDVTKADMLASLADPLRIRDGSQFHVDRVALGAASPIHAAFVVYTRSKQPSGSGSGPQVICSRGTRIRSWSKRDRTRT